MPNSTQQQQTNINKDLGANQSGAQTTDAGTIIQASGAELKQDSTNMALLNWLGCLFFGFIPPLVIMLMKKEDAYVQTQAKEALNWSITFLVVYVVLWVVAMILGFILAFIFAPLAMIPMLVLVLFGFSHLVFCVMGAIKCSSGQDFRVPFNIRLIK